jgi:transcriptional regulator with XRE-family HTH domain
VNWAENPIPSHSVCAHTGGVTAELTLLPPRRLGVLLKDARKELRLSREDVAGRSAFSTADLALVEAGDRLVAEHEVADLIAAYRLDPDTAVPSRTELVIDLDEHTLMAGGAMRTLAGPSPSTDDVLASYLSLVHTLRRTDAGSPLVLREADLSVLAQVLEASQRDVEARLHELMADPGGEVASRVGMLRRRVLLPIAGVVIAVGAVGALLLVQANGADPAPEPVSTPAPEVIVGNDIPIEEIPDVGLTPPQVQERDEAGNLEPQSTLIVDG